MIDLSTIIGAGIIGLAQVAAVRSLVDRTFKQLDETSTSTIRNSALISETVKTLERVQASLDERMVNEKALFDSRNDHDKALVAINTLHEIKGCKTLFQKTPLQER